MILRIGSAKLPKQTAYAINHFSGTLLIMDSMDFPIRKQVGQSKAEVSPLEEVWRLNQRLKYLLGKEFWRDDDGELIRKVVGRSRPSGS